VNGDRNADWVARALIVAMFAVAILWWPSAPEQIPTHWDAAGRINGYSSKFVVLILMPIVALSSYAFLELFAAMRPEQFEGSVKGGWSWLRCACVIMVAGTFGGIVAKARGANLNMSYVVFPLAALVWIAFGNLRARFREAKTAKTTPPRGMRV
jgi:hypothetical protein